MNRNKPKLIIHDRAITIPNYNSLCSYIHKHSPVSHQTLTFLLKFRHNPATIMDCIPNSGILQREISLFKFSQYTKEWVDCGSNPYIVGI